MLNTPWNSAYPVGSLKYRTDYDKHGVFKEDRGEFRSAFCPTFRYYEGIDKSILSVYLDEIHARGAMPDQYAKEDGLNFYENLQSNAR